MRRANCGRAGCDWLAARPRLTWLDMGIYWRQPHQSAPHLINEPEHCTDQQGFCVNVRAREGVCVFLRVRAAACC